MHDMLVDDNVSWYIDTLRSLSGTAAKEVILISVLNLTFPNPLPDSVSKANMFLTVLGKMYQSIPLSCTFTFYGPLDQMVLNYVNRTDQGDVVNPWVFDLPFSCEFERTNHRWRVGLTSENPTNSISVGFLRDVGVSDNGYNFNRVRSLDASGVLGIKLEAI